MQQTGVWYAHGAKIENLISRGISMAEIGRRFGVSRERIRTLLKRHELPTRALMLNQKEVVALLGCCGRFLTGLERKELISPIQSGRKYSPVYYPEGEITKIIAIMGKRRVRSLGIVPDCQSNITLQLVLGEHTILVTLDEQ